jgi:hypothetical protein
VKGKKMIAHIYRSRNKNWLLILTTGAAISQGVISETIYPSKVAAKQAAKQVNAKPWNY